MTSKKPFLILGAIGIVAAIAVVWFVNFSLNPATENGLPPLHLGIDKCAVCGMIISDTRFAVRAQSKMEGGTSTNYTFDDLGCFFEKVQQTPQSRWSGYVYDFDSLAQIKLEEANFEHGQFQTPMGSGWIAHKLANKETFSFDQIRESPNRHLR